MLLTEKGCVKFINYVGLLVGGIFSGLGMDGRWIRREIQVSSINNFVHFGFDSEMSVDLTFFWSFGF